MRSKRFRQYLGLLSAIAAYYLVHEGAHLLYALGIGAFKQIGFLGLGMQIDVYPDKMTAVQMGVFCLVGSVATMVVAYMLVAAAEILLKATSDVFKACMYYVTIAMLLLDPLYLSVLCGFFGGGDMNGIVLLVPELPARMMYGGLLVLHAVLFFRIVLPKYKAAFEKG